MADAADDGFDSFDDNVLLEALECYHQQQQQQEFTTREASDAGDSSTSSNPSGPSSNTVPSEPKSSDCGPSDSESSYCRLGASECGLSEHEPSVSRPGSLSGAGHPESSLPGQGSSSKSSKHHQLSVDESRMEVSEKKCDKNAIGDTPSDKDKSALTDLFAIRSSLDPLTSFAHLMKSKYVNVSDLQAQEWCEQQMVYMINAKWGMLEVLADESGVPVKEVELTTPQMKAGTKIHEQKDLEVNSYVQIEVSSGEDTWALKLLNTVQSIKRLLILGEPFIREVVVFGMPYDHDTLVMGIIDELRINNNEQLELVEVKTRSNRHRPPGKAQIRTHHLQVMVYKQLVDDLVSGAIDMMAVLTKMKLDPSKVLHDNVLTYARSLDIPGSALEEIMSAALDQFRFLPTVDSLVIEYVPQGGDGREILMTDRVEFREDWLKARLNAHFGFWRREKETPGGVDIEEIWKCNNCQFVDICQWRKRMNEECLSRRHGFNANDIAPT